MTQFQQNLRNDMSNPATIYDSNMAVLPFDEDIVQSMQSSMTDPNVWQDISSPGLFFHPYTKLFKLTPS
jgi:hypothetical protein